MTLWLLLLFVLIALTFEFINGFHDTANSIATVVATKALSPRAAVLLAAITNLLGALVGTAVAKTIAAGLIDTGIVPVTSQILICALVGAIVWNLITWWLGLPSSSSHALIGSLCGAALGASNGNWGSIIWSQPATPWWAGKGLLWKIIVPMVTSPLAGFTLGAIIIGIFLGTISFLNGRGGLLTRMTRPRWINASFSKVQWCSSAYMGFAHGLNDAQKTMGIIALAMVGAASAGALDNLPSILEFMRPAPGAEKGEIATWIKLVCAAVMALGTSVGGWRIIKTMGHNMVKLHPVYGVAAESASATVLVTAASLGMPVSTTHSISTAIMGVGFAKNPKTVRWVVIERIVWAWILTLPTTAAMAYALVQLARSMGWL